MEAFSDASEDAFDVMLKVVNDIKAGNVPNVSPFIFLKRSWDTLRSTDGFFDQNKVKAAMRAVEAVASDTDNRGWPLLYQLACHGEWKRLQHLLTVPVQMAMQAEVVQELRAMMDRKVELAGYRTTCGSCWPAATGINPDTRIPSWEFIVACKLRLGRHGQRLPTSTSSQPLQCPLCDAHTVIDPQGTHLLSCPSLPGGKSVMHSSIRNQLGLVCSAARVQHHVEFPVTVQHNGDLYQKLADVVIHDPIPRGESGRPAYVEVKTRFATSQRTSLRSAESPDGGASRLEGDIMAGREVAWRGVSYPAIAAVLDVELRPAVVMCPGGRFGEGLKKTLRALGSVAEDHGWKRRAAVPFAAWACRRMEVALVRACVARVHLAANVIRRKLSPGYSGPYRYDRPPPPCSGSYVVSPEDHWTVLSGGVVGLVH